MLTPKLTVLVPKTLEEPCVEVTWRKGDLSFEVLRGSILDLTHSKKPRYMCTPTADRSQVAQVARDS